MRWYEIAGLVAGCWLTLDCLLLGAWVYVMRGRDPYVYV